MTGDAVPQAMRPALTASNAELIQRMMAADELADAATGPHADAIRTRAANAQQEMDRREREGIVR